MSVILVKIKNQTGEAIFRGYAAWEIHPVMRLDTLEKPAIARLRHTTVQR